MHVDTTGNELYEAICRNPEDDTARLVFADWLEEQGEEEGIKYAHYIRKAINSKYPPEEKNVGSMLAYTSAKFYVEEMNRVNKHWILEHALDFSVLSFGKETEHKIKLDRGFPYLYNYNLYEPTIIDDDKYIIHKDVLELVKYTPITHIQCHGGWYLGLSKWFEQRTMNCIIRSDIEHSHLFNETYRVCEAHPGIRILSVSTEYRGKRVVLSKGSANHFPIERALGNLARKEVWGEEWYNANPC